MTDVELLKALGLTKESPLSEQIVQTTHHWMKACEENAELKDKLEILISVGNICTKGLNDQLTKAKAIINIAIEGIKYWGIVGGTERPFEKQAEELFNLFLDKAEQFLKE